LRAHVIHGDPELTPGRFLSSATFFHTSFGVYEEHQRAKEKQGVTRSNSYRSNSNHTRKFAITLAILLLTLAQFGLLSLNSLAADNDKSDYLQAARNFANSALAKQKNCITCHTIGENGGTVGPILNQISNRRSEEWLRTWFSDPNSLKPGTKMPNFGFSASELDDLLGHLTKMKRTINSEEILAANPDPITAGNELFKAYDCSGCHRIGDKGRFVGPNLTWVGVRKSQQWEANWLSDPSAYKPGTFMPNFSLSPKEINALTAFLHSQQGQANDQARKWESMTSFILDARPRERGRLVAERVACWSCHGEGLTSGEKNPNASPDGLVPDISSAFLDLDEDVLRDIILNGRSPAKLDPAGKEPPFSCPSWEEGLTDSEINDLLAYLESIVPESELWEFE
jgi:cytochrome c2